MKPALLYLRNYIQQNYDNRLNRLNGSSSLKMFNKENKNQEQSIFIEKKYYDRQNTKKKQFYFQPSKQFNVPKLKRKNIKEFKAQDKLEQLFIISSTSGSRTQSQKVQRVKKVQKVQYVIGDPNQIQVNNINETQKDASQGQDQDRRTYKQKTQQSKDQFKNKDKTSVKFIISPPIQQKKKQKQDQSQIQLLELQKSKITGTQRSNKIVKIQQHYISKHKNLGSDNFQIQLQKSRQQTKTDHSRIFSKSMQKVGYNTFSDYLNQMTKFQNTKKQNVKQAHYYPLPLMSPKINQRQEFQSAVKRDKDQFRRKLSYFQREITVLDNFSSMHVEFGSLNGASHRHKRQKSNFKNIVGKTFSKQNDRVPQTNEKKVLLQYQSIFVASCQNNKFFTYKPPNTTDYTSFFKNTTPLLGNKADKQNGYLIGKNKPQNCGLHFCCLINASLSARQCFFWVGKPIQYYKKDQIIKAMDNFLYQIQGINLFQSDKIWIIDYYGRNSFIQKSLLNKCKQIKPSAFIVKKPISKISKRINLSTSQLLSNIETSDASGGMLANSHGFTQSVFVKKQRKNISTKGNFELVYSPSQNEL